MDPAPAHCIARVLEQILAGQSCVLELSWTLLSSDPWKLRRPQQSQHQVRAAPGEGSTR